MQNYNYDEKRKPRPDNQSQEDWFIKFENGGKKRKSPVVGSSSTRSFAL